MQKNWYAVYTKPDCEKKIAALFSKWKFENYYALNCVRTNVSWRSKLNWEPLFKSYVFVKISEDKIEKIQKLEGVVNFLYWLGKPAVIKTEEIEAIKELTEFYQDIKLERTIVNINSDLRIIDKPSYSIEGNFISVKSKTVTLNLPSLGYKLTAERARETVNEKQGSLLENLTAKFSFQRYKTA